MLNQSQTQIANHSPSSVSSRIQPIRDHYNACTPRRDHWIRKNRFYHQEILKYYRFFIPSQSSILELGCGTGDLLAGLSPSHGVGVDISFKMVQRAQEKYPGLEFICGQVEEFIIDRKFDYVIISGTLGSVENIQGVLQQIPGMMHAHSRIILNCYNPLWEPVLRLGEKIGLKMPDVTRNWLSLDDIENFLNISGYEVIRRDFLMLLPVKVPFLTTVFNKFIGILPVFRRLAMTHCIVARPYRAPDNADELTISVVLTCRDEEENIEGLVQNIPQLGKHTEIIFVEGHSQDRTVEKVREMIRKYPEKDIKLFHQKGIGQADAFRQGFARAQGDFLVWLEADLTIDPGEITLFWDAYISGEGEYINGTRFIYPMEEKSMPFLNFIGNRFFGNIFTPLLGQRFTDTLCGLKAVSRKDYLKIKQQMNDFGDFDPFGDFQLIFGAIRSCLKVVEIPVHYRPRRYGQSKAYGKTFLSFLKNAWLLIKMSWTAFVKFRFY